MQFIPLNRSSLLGKEFEYMEQAVREGRTSGDGPFTVKCNALLEEALGARKAMLTTSCTHALEMAALLLEIGPGDEVIVPSFTFVTSAGAFVLRGARPVFVDIRPDTLNLDESLIEDRLTDRARVIVPVHYGGVGCEMDAVMEIAERRGVAVVEDNAHGLFGEYKGRRLGSFGVLAAQSFHETKSYSCGEGGALVINDPDYAQRAEIIREKGTNRSLFFRGGVDKYTWVDIGSSYLLSDILAAFLYAQLECRERVQARRREIWEFYAESLRDWAAGLGAALPAPPPHCEQPHHIFHLLMPTFEDRRAFIKHLAERGVQSAFHYLPLHLSDVGRRFGGREGDCPVAEDVSRRLVRLPLYYDLSDEERERVVEEARKFGG